MQLTISKTKRQQKREIDERIIELYDDREIARHYLEMQLTPAERKAYKKLETLLTLTIIELDKHL